MALNNGSLGWQCMAFPFLVMPKSVIEYLAHWCFNTRWSVEWKLLAQLLAIKQHKFGCNGRISVETICNLDWFGITFHIIYMCIYIHICIYMYMYIYIYMYILPGRMLSPTILNMSSVLSVEAKRLAAAIHTCSTLHVGWVCLSSWYCSRIVPDMVVAIYGHPTMIRI